jgi:hypothetical protein
MSAPPATKKICDEVISQIGKTVKNYDNIIVLGTLLVILRANEAAYNTFFNNGANAAIFTNLQNNIGNVDAFEFVKQVLLNSSNVGNSPGKDVKTNIQLKIQNGDNKNAIQIDFNNHDITNTAGFNPDQTKLNLEQKFINLAQVFYECGFNGKVFDATNLTNSKGIGAAIIDGTADATGKMVDGINPDIVKCQLALNAIANKDIEFKIHVIYCSGMLTYSRFNEKDFTALKNIKFQTNNIPGTCKSGIKTYIGENEGKTKHTVVFLDGLKRDFTQTDLDDILDLFDDDDNKSLDLITYDMPTITPSKTLKNIRVTQVIEEVWTTGKPKAENRIMFRGNGVKRYATMNMDDTGAFNASNVKTIQIDKALNREKKTQILDYILFSKLVVDIRSL